MVQAKPKREANYRFDIIVIEGHDSWHTLYIELVGHNLSFTPYPITEGEGSPCVGSNFSYLRCKQQSRK
jgi:hypothetical protein